MEIFLNPDLYQNQNGSGIIIFLKELMENLKNQNHGIYIPVYIVEEYDTIFKNTIVYEGLQYDGRQKSVALLVQDLEI